MSSRKNFRWKIRRKEPDEHLRAKYPDPPIPEGTPIEVLPPGRARNALRWEDDRSFRQLSETGARGGRG